MTARFDILLARRVSMAAILIVAGTLFLAAPCLRAETPPNILFILTDDQRDHSFSSTGHEWIETPNIDELISRGTRFKNTYIAEPTCAPSRASFFLGCHERVNHLGFSYRHEMNESQWAHSYPALLKKVDYHTGFVGKWHVKTDGFTFETLFDYCEGHEGHGEFYYENKDPSGGPEFVTTNRRHTDNALRFLDTVPEGRPFCLSLCYATPHTSKVRKMHEPFDESASLDPRLKDHPIYGGLYRDLDISYPLQSPGTREDPYDHIPKSVLDQDKGRKKTYSMAYESAANKEYLYRYYQMITELDEMIGEIVADLEKRELTENTILVFASDHGLLLGEYGMGGKSLLYDLVMKIPCFVVDPRAPATARGQVREELVSSLDITTTILDYAGVEKTGFMEGVSLKPLVRSTESIPSWRTGLFLENLYTGRDTPLQEGYIDLEEGWKYVRFFKAPGRLSDEDFSRENEEPVFEQLFHLRNDPGERNNRIASPEVAEIADRLRAKCIAEATRLNQARQEYASQYLEE